jgi:DNA modification methylase
LKREGMVILCGLMIHHLQNWKYWERFFNPCGELIWEKTTGSTPPRGKYQPALIHDTFVLLYAKGINPIELKADFWGGGGVVEKKKIMELHDERPGEVAKGGVHYVKSVYHAPRVAPGNKEYFGHPTQKSLNLMKLLVECTTEEGDWVLDPFAGSGTTLVACEELKRNALGIEIDKEYYEMAIRRIEICRNVKKLLEYTTR